MAINPTTPSAAPKQSRQPAELETDDQQLQQQQIDTTVGVVNQQPTAPGPMNMNTADESATRDTQQQQQQPLRLRGGGDGAAICCGL
ncbi:hypothetical protein HRR80_008887 [Exophiala dermatitidis]|nr:hypothetical protein HRR77_009544 [Exophiala dermatitidis]KAJ4540034.1 hypothetical protein HRR76_003453 [Exophiala dermatitidis]KAJ4557175.1 hypothetical protein HRR79_008637 [Exophiala dermatitidis]KAJ4577657.1 hypothetical protein HRR82_005520 [Exophiala dermatitidis]KAJ4608859.1 hypothetical protein HRR85_007195 [Exophiala dermatitidis]